HAHPMQRIMRSSRCTTRLCEYQIVPKGDITMNDTLSVPRIQRIADFDPQRQYRLNLQRPASNAVLQRCAIQKLHGDERLAILLANFVDSADIGMVEGRSSPSLAAEAFQRRRVLPDILGRNLSATNRPSEVSSAL